MPLDMRYVMEEYLVVGSTMKLGSQVYANESLQPLTKMYVRCIAFRHPKSRPEVSRCHSDQ